jgi:hypothetical protein
MTYKIREPEGGGRTKEYHDALQFFNEGKCDAHPDMDESEAKRFIIANTVWQRNRKGDLEADVNKTQVKAFLAMGARLTAHLTPAQAEYWTNELGPLQVRTDKVKERVSGVSTRHWTEDVAPLQGNPDKSKGR